MHLVIVTPYPPHITGIGQYGYHISQGLARSGQFAKITILTGEAPHFDVKHPMTIHYGWQSNQWDVAQTITSQIEQLQPDLVWFNLGASIFGHSPLANISGYSSVFRTRQMGFPTVVTVHELLELADLHSLRAPGGILAKYGASIMTHLATRADVTCLTMKHYAEWLKSHNTTQKYLHIPLGAYRTPELLPETEEPELLFFTTLAPFKGLEVLLEAFRAIQAEHPNVKLTIAGTEHVRFPGYVTKLQNDFGELKNIQWLGQVAEEEVRNLFARAQIVVIPYTASTGASSVVMQAAMWGRSIIASDLPEIKSVVSENNFRLTLFQSGDVSSLVKALQSQLGSPTQRQTQIQHNFAVMQHHRPQDMSHAYLRAFNLALESRRHPQRITIPAITPESA